MSDDTLEATPPEWENDPTIETARLGIEAQQFTNSNLFRYMVGRAKSEIEKQTAKLVDVDPDNAKGIRDIQNMINKPKMALSWIEEVIKAGKLAVNQLHEEDAAEE